MLSAMHRITAPLLTFVAIGYIFSHTVTDPDLWGHVRFGQDTIAARAIIQQDTYSYLTEGQRWINHEWLAEVIFAGSYNLAGSTGLILVKLLLILSTMAVVYSVLTRSGLSPPLIFLLLLLASAALTGGARPVRPQLFTYLFFAITLYTIYTYEHRASNILWVLVPVFLFWVNLHGGFLAGIGLLGGWLCYHVFYESRRSPRSLISSTAAIRLFAPVASSVLVTLVNPYGLGLWTFLLATATIPRPEISEWAPLSIRSADGVAYGLLLLVTGRALLTSPRERSGALCAVYICMALAPLIALRHLPLWGLASVLLAGEHIQDGLERRWNYWVSASPRRVAVGTGLGALGLLVLLVPNLSQVKMERDAPVRAVQLIRENVSHEATLAVDFDWGEYALWHLGPGVKVSVDGRRETVYSPEVYQQNLNFMLGRAGWDRLIDSRRTDLALVAKNRPAYPLMMLKPGWVLVYEDPLSALFVADGSPARPRLQTATPPEVPYNGEGLSFP